MVVMTMFRKKNTPSQKFERNFNEEEGHKIPLFHDWDATLKSLLRPEDETNKGELLFSTIENLYALYKMYKITTTVIPMDLTGKE